MDMNRIESQGERERKMANATNGIVDTIQTLQSRFQGAQIFYLGCGRTFRNPNPMTDARNITQDVLRDRHEDCASLVGRVEAELTRHHVHDVIVRDAFTNVSDTHVLDVPGHLNFLGSFEVGRFIQEALDEA
jgi:hypothetical protein